MGGFERGRGTPIFLEKNLSKQPSSEQNVSLGLGKGEGGFCTLSLFPLPPLSKFFGPATVCPFNPVFSG